MTPANDAIEDNVLDDLLVVYHDELQRWNMVGPLVERRQHLPDREYYQAVRTEEGLDGVRPEPLIIRFHDRSDAISCIQWHGLKAVCTAFLGVLAAPASEETDTPNG